MTHSGFLGIGICLGVLVLKADTIGKYTVNIKNIAKYDNG